MENYELNLLSNISNILISKNNPADIVRSLEKFINRFGKLTNMFVRLEKLNIYLYDEHLKTLRDFSKSWIIIEKKDNNFKNNKLYEIMKNISNYSFYINDTPYKQNTVEYGKIKTLTEGNTIYIPLKNGNKHFGIIELIFPQDIKYFMSEAFFKMLYIASFQISLKIQNSILTEQMQKNINFHKAMKDIAKIIESQYDLSYVIPIIGEMIDRFVADHLIYMFLKTDKKFNLVWPSTCIDKNIFEMVSKIKTNIKPIISDDGKTGIFPLSGANGIFGCIAAKGNIDKLSNQEISYIEQLTKQSSITINRANEYAEILKYATSDALTGLNNRRQFEERLKQEVSNARRQKHPLCAIMIDIDYFKKVNDTYGHYAGDVVLKKVASIIKSELREYDIPSRYGGEEFVILLPSTKLSDAYIAAERLRKSVEDKAIDIPNEKNDSISHSINVTISLGVYEYKEKDTAQEFYQNADKALYVAKNTGRNRVIVNNDELEEK